MWSMILLQIDLSPTLDERIQRVLAGLGDVGIDLLLAAIVLLIGWVAALLVSRFIQWILRATRFNEAVRRVMGTGGTRLEPAAMVSWMAHWLVILVAVIVAADLLGFDLSHSVGDRLRDVLPRVVAATIVLAVGIVVAMAIGSVARAVLSGAGVRSSRLRSQAVVVVLVGFAFLLALEQLGLAAQFIMALGLTAVAAVALAAGLAFGLGCRDLARDLVVEYLRSSTEEAPQR